MSLEKRFQKLFNGQVVNENRTKGSVQICDEFAVGFLNWYAMHGSWIEENLTSKELLEIYKQGL